MNWIAIFTSVIASFILFSVVKKGPLLHCLIAGIVFGVLALIAGFGSFWIPVAVVLSFVFLTKFIGFSFQGALLFTLSMGLIEYAVGYILLRFF